MTLLQLKYIVAIDQYRHFGKAAESCGLTQSTLSLMVKKLEDELDVRIFDRRHGDKFIVCSDGLLCHVSDPEIRDIMERSKSAQEAVRLLISGALKRGGFDNVTVACYYQA